MDALIDGRLDAGVAFFNNWAGGQVDEAARAIVANQDAGGGVRAFDADVNKSFPDVVRYIDKFYARSSPSIVRRRRGQVSRAGGRPPSCLVSCRVELRSSSTTP